MLNRLIPFMPVLLAAGCLSSGDQALDTTSDATRSLREVMVYETGIVCVTDPCASYQVVDRMGNAFDVATLEFDADATRPRDPAFGALIVRGHIDFGDWSPGEAGNVLKVLDSLGPPPLYLTHDLHGGDLGFAFIAEDHVKGFAWDVDLTPLALEDIEARGVRADLRNARIIARGWMTVQSLWVVDIVDTPEVYTVADNSIRCVIDPCPSISVFGPDGEELFMVASLDVDAMELAPEAAATAVRTFMEGVPLRAWHLNGSWQPHDTGAVLYVTGAHSADGAPVMDWGPLTFERHEPTGPVLK